MTQGLIVRIALWVFGLLTVGIVALAVFNDKGALQVHARSEKLNALQAEVQKLELENQKLNDEIKALRTDPTTIERLAREQLGLVRPGEVVLVTPESSPKQ